MAAQYPTAPFPAAAYPERYSGYRVLRQRYHYHPVFQDSPPMLPHAGNAAHIFPSSVTIPCSTCIKALPLILKQANISPRSSPLITFIDVPDVFVSLHTDIPFQQMKTAGIFVVKVHILPWGIYLHRNLPFLLGYRPARNHL